MGLYPFPLKCMSVIKIIPALTNCQEETSVGPFPRPINLRLTLVHTPLSRIRLCFALFLHHTPSLCVSGRDCVTNTQTSVVHLSRLFHSLLLHLWIQTPSDPRLASAACARAKTGRGNRRVSVEEATCHHVSA